MLCRVCVQVERGKEVRTQDAHVVLVLLFRRILLSAAFASPICLVRLAPLFPNCSRSARVRASVPKPLFAIKTQLDIFLFKRFYEDVRCKLDDLVKKDYSLALLESGTCTHRFRRFSNLA